MAALAARCPSVAAALEATGLTAQQRDAYRVALASARVTKNVKEEKGVNEDVLGPVEPTSVMGRNMEFMVTHPDEFQALERVSGGQVRFSLANMWYMP